MSLSGKSNNAIRRPDLQQYVVEYVEGKVESMNGFVAGQVLPIYPVSEESGTYDVVPKEAWLKVQDDARAPDGSYARNNWQYETGTYETQERGREERLDDVKRKQFDARNGDGSSELLTVDRVMKAVMRRREQRASDLLFNATNFNPNSLTNAWSNKATATPIDDIKTGKSEIRNESGMLPNVLIINYNVFANLKRCNQVVDLLTYNYGKEVNLTQISIEQLASILEVPRIIVAGAMYDSSAGGQDATITELWPDQYAMLTVISDGMDITEPQVGRTFLWEDDSTDIPITEQYREEQTRSDIYRVRYYGQEQLIASRNTSGTIVSNISQAVSYLFDNVTT